MNGIILYGSRYGAARQYAQALEERTGLPAVSYAEVRDFGPFDTIVYVGGLYVGKTTGLAKTARRLPTDHPFRLLVATVGLADPANEDNLLSIRESLAKELSPGIFVRTAHVPLRGAIDYRALSTKHRLMMKGLCAILRRQPVTERTADTQALLDGYGNAVSFIDFDTLAPIEAWLKKG
ncbi:MAG: flavodoxin domain-containing protein [Evtepia gabavorous]